MPTVPPNGIPRQPASHPSNKSSTSNISSSYDFIIIGGGTAGLVLAARLSEDPEITVLVLEAGADRLQDPKILTPGLAGSMLNDQKYDWDFYTVPQKGLNNRRINHQRGKVLGGSSAINQLQMAYNSPSCFNAWEKLGNPGWSYESMLPYLRKFHTFHNPTSSDQINTLNGLYHSDFAVDEDTEGPIHTSYSDMDDIDRAWYESWENIMRGFGYDGDELGGFLQSQSIDPRTRTRSYAGSGYYSSSISSRSNLRVVTEALVEKIVLSKGVRKEVQAQGVQFISRLTGTRYTISMKKEIILSAGVFKSPQILELSGIGNKDLFEEHGIELYVDNANVGENLMDHLFVPVSFEVADGIQTTDSVLRNLEVKESLLERYQKDRSGPMGHFCVKAANMKIPELFEPEKKDFIHELYNTISPSPKSEAEETKDKITIELNTHSSTHLMLSKSQFNVLGNSRISDMFIPISDRNYITIFSALTHPFSRGNVHINSRAPKTYPTINPRYFSHEMDIELTARHLLFIQQFMRQEPFKGFLKKGGRTIPRGIFEGGMEGLKEVVRRTAVTNWSPAGTCAMGRREMGGVVDQRLRVHGVMGLRVCDASVFPALPRGALLALFMRLRSEERIWLRRIGGLGSEFLG